MSGREGQGEGSGREAVLDSTEDPCHLESKISNKIKIFRKMVGTKNLFDPLKN